MQQTIFPNWNEVDTQLWGNQPLKLRHTIAESPLFSMDALADLVDRYPREHYSLIHMGAQGQRRLWKEGDIGGMKGREVIDWIANGRMWLNLRQVKLVDRRYADLLDAAYSEIALRSGGAPVFNTTMGILISSPNAQVYFHADLPGQALWQIHGRKRVYVYPAGAPFLRPEQIEDIALFGVEVDMAYEAWFDAYAQVIELGPGEMAHWPLNAPHRVENLDMLNVSVTTEHWTEEIERRHKVNMANALLRHRLGWTPASRSISGAAYHAKALFQGALRRTPWVQRQRAARRPIEFRLDPSRPGAITELAPTAN